MFTTFYLGPYQPLSWMSYAFDYLVWGINPVGYHLTNVMFHAANAGVFYLVSRRLLIAGFSISDETPSNWLNASAAPWYPLIVDSSVTCRICGLGDGATRRPLGLFLLRYALLLFANGDRRQSTTLLLPRYPCVRFVIARQSYIDDAAVGLDSCGRLPAAEAPVAG
jgi:hypothetical protein